MRDQPVKTKAIVTVTEMARMVGLSRSRFYQLVDAGVFPQPVYYVSTRRPIYVEEQQQVCLEVRRRNCGVNGRPVLFYARGHRQPTTTKPARTTKPATRPTPDHGDLLDGLSALGLAATVAQVGAALAVAYPGGTDGLDRGEVLRQVFLFLKRQNTGDNVGR